MVLLYFTEDYLPRNHGVLDSDVLVGDTTLMKLIWCALLQALQAKLLHAWTSGKSRRGCPCIELKGE